MSVVTAGKATRPPGSAQVIGKQPVHSLDPSLSLVNLHIPGWWLPGWEKEGRIPKCSVSLTSETMLNLPLTEKINTNQNSTEKLFLIHQVGKNAKSLMTREAEGKQEF